VDYPREPDETCDRREVEHRVLMADLSATPHVRPEDGAGYARCTERDGLRGSHESIEGVGPDYLLVVREGAIDLASARVVRDPSAFVPTSTFDGGFSGVDTSGDGKADWVLGEQTERREDDYPMGVAGGYDCQETRRLEGGAWRLAFRACRHRCELVTP
jgi:hypothetical protein